MMFAKQFPTSNDAFFIILRTTQHSKETRLLREKSMLRSKQITRYCSSPT